MAGKPLLEGSLRVSVGTLAQMERFWRAFQAIQAREGEPGEAFPDLGP